MSVCSWKGRVALKTHSEGVFREATDDSAEPVFRKLILKYNRNSEEHCANFLPSDAHPGRTEAAAGCEAEELENREGKWRFPGVLKIAEEKDI